MILTKVFGASSVLLLAGCGMLYGLLKGAEAESEALQSQISALVVSNEAQRTTIDGLSELATTNAIAIQSLGNTNNEIRQRTNDAIGKLNSLRSTEAANAIQSPFKRGVASYKRRVDILMRINPTKGSDVSDSGIIAP